MAFRDVMSDDAFEGFARISEQCREQRLVIREWTRRQIAETRATLLWRELLDRRQQGSAQLYRRNRFEDLASGAAPAIAAINDRVVNAAEIIAWAQDAERAKRMLDGPAPFLAQQLADQLRTL